MSRLLVITGIIIVIIGLLWPLLSKMSFLGRLPGDVVIHKKNLTFYFPLGTSLFISAVLSIILWLMSRR